MTKDLAEKAIDFKGKKYGKTYFDKHAKVMRIAKQVKKDSKNKDIKETELST